MVRNRKEFQQRPSRWPIGFSGSRRINLFRLPEQPPLHPPATTRVCPVTCRARVSEDRYTTALAMSSGRAIWGSAHRRSDFADGFGVGELLRLRGTTVPSGAHAINPSAAVIRVWGARRDNSFFKLRVRPKAMAGLCRGIIRVVGFAEHGSGRANHTALPRFCFATSRKNSRRQRNVEVSTPSSVPATVSPSPCAAVPRESPRSGIRDKGVHRGGIVSTPGQTDLLPVTPLSGPHAPGRAQPLPIRAVISVRRPDCGDNAERAWPLHRQKPAPWPTRYRPTPR